MKDRLMDNRDCLHTCDCLLIYVVHILMRLKGDFPTLAFRQEV